MILFCKIYCWKISQLCGKKSLKYFNIILFVSLLGTNVIKGYCLRGWSEGSVYQCQCYLCPFMSEIKKEGKREEKRFDGAMPSFQSSFHINYMDIQVS